MDFALIWTERTLSDLAEIVRFYREDRKISDTAVRVGTEIIEHVEVLKSFLDIGPLYSRKAAFIERCFVITIVFSIASIMKRALFISRAFGMADKIPITCSSKNIGHWFGADFTL